MKPGNVNFRQYATADYESCLQLFNENCPEFFAENERQDFERFLSHPRGRYEVGVLGDRVVAAFGTAYDPESGRGRVSWIMVSPSVHGTGIGTRMMQRISQTARDNGIAVIDIAASHISAPFFAAFGAREIGETRDGWGEGMHRVDMAWQLQCRKLPGPP